MKREGGLWATAAVLGIAATVGISTTKNTPPSPITVAPKVTKSYIRPSTPKMEELDNGPCPDLEKLLQAFFLIDEAEIIAPKSCYPDEQQTPPNSTAFLGLVKQLRFVIATLPDPLHTHFPLSFDRATEAIQEAAQDDGNYVYDSSWLPWDTEEASYALLEDQDKAEKRKEQQEDQPGILLFRGALADQKSGDGTPKHPPFDKGLAVLIVGEEPTGGIHRRQFENAQQWIAALQPTTDANSPPVQILGPTFSGSIPSLVDLLREPPNGLSGRVGQHLRIFSGSVSSNAGVDWLNRAKDKSDLASLNIQFRSFEHSGDLDLDRYCRYMNATGTDLGRLAIVSEDETAFGSEYGSDGSDGKGGNDPNTSPCRPGTLPDGQHKQGPVYLYYPRDISELRAAYQSQSIFNHSATQPSGDSSHHVLQSDLADPKGKDHDTIRAYGGDQTALSQEAELQQIVSLMRAHRTEYVLLRSSNPLDQLFLSHYFRMTYPEGRIVLVGADLLLRRETGAGGLNGVMTLSTYPLLPWGQDWTRDLARPNTRFHSHRVFANDGVEGAYVAARFLLRQPPITPPGTEPPSPRTHGEEDSTSISFVPRNCIDELNLPDYALPFWMNRQDRGDCRYPPTWLSALGNGGFWPVAVLDFPTCVGCPRPPPIRELGETETLSSGLRHSITSIFSSIAFLLGIKPNDGSAGAAPQAWLPMPPSMKLLLFAGLFWAIFHALCCCRASLTVKPAHRAHFVRPNCCPSETECDVAYLRRQRIEHRALVLFGSLLVALLPITLAWGYGEMWEGGEPLPNPWPYRVFLSLTWLIAGIGVCANTWVEDYLFERNDPMPFKETKRKRISRVIRAFLGWTRECKVPAEVWRSLRHFLGLTLLLYWCVAFWFDGALNDANRIPTYWRAINLTTGLSPLVPLVSLIAGLYGWFWYALQGLAFFGEDRPRLPKSDSLIVSPSKQQGVVVKGGQDLLRMLSRDWAEEVIEELNFPFAIPAVTVAGISFVAIIVIGWSVFGYPAIRSLGSRAYSVVFCLSLALCISILLANAWQLSRVWLRLRHLLQFLDKLPLRRTLAAVNGFSWGSVWKMGGSVLDMRYKILFRQLESWTHLRESLPGGQEKPFPGLARVLLGKKTSNIEPSTLSTLIEAIETTSTQRLEFAKWYSFHWDDWKARRLTPLKSVQHSLAEMAAILLTQLLIPAWREEDHPMPLALGEKAEESGNDRTAHFAESVATLPPHLRNAEELVCLVYMAFIQNILGRMRSLVMGIICLFLSITVAVARYPFDPRPLISSMVVVLFAILALTIIAVYSQMHRDPTLSSLTGTKPGELGADFWFKLVGFGAGPVLGLLASVFPEFTDFIFSWIQPGIASIK
jgi:hypothetical protein